METDIKQQDGVTIVAVAGRVDAYTAPELEERVLDAIAGQTKLAVDLSGTDYVSSAGLRVLITLAKRARAGDFQMRLCGLQEAVREVFDIAGFTALFELTETQAEALAELNAG